MPKVRFIDLFAGAGKARDEDSKQIIPGSPLYALNLTDPFTHYIFCEVDQKSVAALEKRISKYFSSHLGKCVFCCGDCNNSISDFLKKMPKLTHEDRGLTFCLIDPYKASDITFATIQELAQKIYVDFLILIPTYMDINRNEKNYTRKENNTIERFLGNPQWRETWDKQKLKGLPFGISIADQFGCRMRDIGFLYEGPDTMELISMPSAQKLPLYHLAFFSKNKTGLSFWKETKKQTKVQLELL